jgi:hypothetical protein
MEHSQIKDNTSFDDNCTPLFIPLGNIESDDEDMPLRLSAVSLPKANSINSSKYETDIIPTSSDKENLYLPISIKFVEDPKQEVNDFEQAMSELSAKPRLIIPGYDLAANEEEYITESSLIELQAEPKDNMKSYRSTIKEFNLLKGKLLKPAKPLKDIHKKGNIELKKSGVLDRWKPRYCSIEKSQCLIYRSDATELLASIINFRQFLTTLEMNIESLVFTYYLCISYRVIVYSRHRVKKFTFRTKTQEEFVEWTETISFYIEKNKNNNWRQLDVEKFWKFRIMTTQEFEIVAATGDVLLFTSNYVVSKFQRVFTQSRFGTLIN